MRKLIVPVLVLLFLITSVYGEIQITEIMYNPVGSNTGKQWVELYNNGDEVNMLGWKFVTDGSNHGLSLYQGEYVIQEHGFAIIARNGDNFILDHPGYNGTIFSASFDNLVIAGEEVSIRGNSLNEVDSLTYLGGASDGFSVEVVSPYLDNGNNVNWVIGKENGDPGNVSGLVQEEENNPDMQVPEFGNLGIFLLVVCVSAFIIRNRK